MRIENSGIGPNFWWRWISACLIGWFLGFFFGFVIAGSLESVMASGPLQSTLAYLVLGIFIGTGVGLMQWRLVRQRLSGIGLWVVASAAGMGMAGGLGYGAAVLIFGYSVELDELGTVTGALGWAVIAACGGVIAGLLQRRVLTRHGVEAGRWVLVSGLGWALSFAACGIISAVLFRIEPITPVLGSVAFFVCLISGGAVLGAVTATTAREFLGKRQVRPSDESPHG